MGFPRPARRLLAGGLLLLCVLVFEVSLPAAAAFAAPASIGVGVQAGPVRLAGAAHAGGSYALPALLVVNTGTQPESVRVRVQRLAAGPGRPVPRSWIRVTGPAHLAARESAQVPLTLVVPAGARPGAYASDLIAAGSARLAAGPADLAAAAAAKLLFRVAAGPPPPGTGQAQAPGRGTGGLPAAAKWALTVLVLLALAVLAARWSGIRIRIERAGPPQADEGARQ